MYAFLPSLTDIVLTIGSAQEIIRANERVVIAADLVTKYRKNVQYNLQAMRGSES